MNNKMMSIPKRVMNVEQALWFADKEIPRFVMQETGMAAHQAIKAIIPALLASLAVVTLTTVVGAGIGAAIGSLGAGIGAVPLGIEGGYAGFEAGMWILNIVGLAFLFEYMGGSLWEAVHHIKDGILRAWGPTSNTDYWYHDGNVFKSADEIALGVAIVIRCILEGIVLYLTAKGVSKLPELVAALKRSKLGEGFGVWVEQNYQEMMSNPKLNRRVGTGAAKETPAKVIGKMNAPEKVGAEVELAPKVLENGTAEQTTVSKEWTLKKLDEYLLNAEHSDGGSKAKWFDEALGFNKTNMNDLAKQIVFDEKNAIPTTLTEYGQKYNQVINIVGANGKKIDVTFAWIKNNDGIVRLITGIPTKR